MKRISVSIANACLRVASNKTLQTIASRKLLKRLSNALSLCSRPFVNLAVCEDAVAHTVLDCIATYAKIGSISMLAVVGSQ